MKNFKDFSARVQHGSYKHEIKRRVRGEIATIPAAALLGQNSVDKLADTIADVSLDICLSMLEAYHSWSREPS